VAPTRLAIAAVVVPWYPVIANSAIAVRMTLSRLSCALILPMSSFSLWACLRKPIGLQ
jgi:hypothetical protein